MWCRSFIFLLFIQWNCLCILGAALRNPQHKKHGSHSKTSKVDHRHLHAPPTQNTPDSQCDKDAKAKYREDAVAIETCAEVKGFKTKIAEALKSDDHKGAFDACEEVLMSCVGLSLACAKRQIPLMLDRANQKKAKDQLSASKHKDQINVIMKDPAESASDSHSSSGLSEDPDHNTRAPSRLGGMSKEKSRLSPSEHLERGIVPRQGVADQHAHAAKTVSPKQDGVIELCNRNGLRVVLDTRSNSRRMTFGDNAWEKLIQTAVNCKGAPEPTCTAATKSTCDLVPERCPCEFQMQKLPPLDHEYQYIAEEVLKKDEEALDISLSRKLTVALVGLGGGMIAQYLISHSTQLSVDAIELNSDVIAAARAFFGIAKPESNGRLRVLEGDGLTRLNEAPPASYGVVVVDCFGNGRVPESCRSQAFVEAAYHAMQPGAEILQNVLISRPGDPAVDKLIRQDLEDLLNQYRKVFGQHEVELQSKWAHGDNAVVRAKKRGSVK